MLKEKTNDIGPAILLMIVAPLLTEVLPGATRFSSIFVFPIEVCVWGGGALLIRYVVRKWKLGWLNMLFLAIALSLAEEFIIQQTSIAPMVIHLKGVTYARAGGVNYVYLLWALIYESVFVVFVPVYLVELIFPDRKERLWISKGGFFAVIPLFLLGSYLAWFSWTHIARPKFFHVPIFTPPVLTMILALLSIFLLAYMALGLIKVNPSQKINSSVPPAPGLLLFLSALWTFPLYGIVLLGFGIDPDFPPAIAVCVGVLLIILPIWLLPRWSAGARWSQHHLFALLFGTILGSMLISFLGFIGTPGPDLNFKIITNILAGICLILLGFRIKSHHETSR